MSAHPPPAVPPAALPPPAFEPIAIVGRSCVLPGALSPEALWDAVVSGRDLVSSAPAGRWGTLAVHAQGTPEASADRAWSERGGYVSGFESVFDPRGFSIPADQVLGLDPLFQWVLHVTREALRDSGITDVTRTGLVLGNLSFPSSSMSRFAERVWLGEAAANALGIGPVDARNRFMSGLPAHLAARALGLSGAAFSLDAACASSLVALEIACARLHDRQDDVMLAGAVNRADDLFIHTGFCALGALSKTGRSRPFHAEADGLIPAEGAGVLVLQRLADAVAEGRLIYGVIRGVGTSNDGRGSGLLVPSRSGQEVAMRRAFEGSGLSPADVSLLECHATGTTIGDRTEIESTSAVYAGVSELPVGSLKSNLGHLITAAGVAGVIKILEAQRHGIRPPSLGAERQNPALAGSALRVVTQAEAWTGRRAAGISAFGFGGNNAHALIEPYDPARIPLPPRRDDAPREALAITGVAILADVQEAILPLGAVRFPPRDLEQTLGQQLLVLQAAMQATSGLELDADRTSVLVGMGCDPEVARYGARWRLPAWQQALGQTTDGAAKDQIVPVLQSAGVIGTMPNIPANRINSHMDLRGGSMTVSSEQLSGIRALQIASQKLRHHDMDAAIVGAVDLSCEPVHRAALAALGMDTATRDAAVVLVLERLRDAQSRRRPIIAILDDVAGQTLQRAPTGGPHAASGLLAVAEAALSAREGESVTMRIDGMEGQTAEVTVIGGPAQPGPAPTPERAMRYPLHQAPVALPDLGGAAASTPSIQVMAPAPALESTLLAPNVSALSVSGLNVSVLSVSALSVSALNVSALNVSAPTLLAPTMRAPTVGESGPARVPSPLASAAPVAGAASASHPLMQEITAHYARVSGIHRTFLAQQAEVHTRFLALRQLPAFPPPALAAVSHPASPPALAVAPPVPARTVAASAPIVLPRPVPVPAPATTPNPVARAVTPTPVQALTPPGPETPSGPSFTREQLEVHASGRISTLFGPLFEQQDGWARQVRMPTPPLLLCDRVTGIRGTAGSMGKGTIWTETDVRWDSWYLHEGRMPAGVMIEAGQADLMLISWLGADFANKGERMYRLLGCELTYHGGLPQPGDTLRYDIHVDGHARQGDVRLFFFHYDCSVSGSVRLSVRQGQAGFFTEAELSESLGVLWSAETAEPCANPRLDAPSVACTRTALTQRQLQAFAEGHVLECFGPGFEPACPHTRTPRISGGRMLWLEEVTHLDPRGGPWGRGYLRAIDTIAPDDWFFDGHFHNDPCMPGTMMFEGCLQAMSVFATSLGYTLDKDGWVFEPVPDQPYALRCRGEVDPASKELIYEIFVEEVENGPHPTIWADLLCTVDGLKAFHCRRMGMRLVPAFPLDSRPDLPGPLDTIPVAEHDGFRFDYEALLACAWGKPSLAFGALYKPFDPIGKVPRLPSPPYHFMTRVTHASGVGKCKAGAKVTVEYDIPKDVWYFRENGGATMPFCVLLEAALQPCGWLASGIGSIVGEAGPLFFRNLDGTGTLHRELLPGDGTLRTEVSLTSVSKSAGMIIEGFEVRCLIGDELIYDMTTVFGFFPGQALANQVGLSTPDADRALLNAPSTEVIDLRTQPERYFGAGKASLPAPFLRVIDKVDGIWRDGGEAALGRYRSTKAVDPNEWYFKAHFHQDPVQPGSLGIEAMIQLLQFAMLDKGLDAGIPEPRFEPIGIGDALTWKYRGQVRPHNKTVNATLEVTGQGKDERGPWIRAKASLWVDGMRIYEASNLGMRIVSGAINTSLWAETIRPGGAESWVRDHCPTWTVPALPMACMLDRLASAASGEGRLVIGLQDVRVRRWLVVDEDTEIRADVKRGNERAAVTLFNDEGPIASGTVLLGCAWTMGPAPLRPLLAERAPDPYASGALFHGPAFQVQRSLWMGDSGSSALLDATSGPVPIGVLNPRLIDGATHGIPHDRLDRWCPEIGADQVAYPALVTRMSIHGPTPAAGTVRCEARFAGFHGGPRFPAFEVQLVSGDRVWASFRLVEALFPKGPLGVADRVARRAFLRDRTWADVTLSRLRPDGTTELTDETVQATDWLPGTVKALYGTTETETIARREHVARLVGVHPSVVDDALPLTRLDVGVERQGTTVVARATAPETLDLSSVKTFWTRWFDRGPWAVEDLYYGLIQRFVRRVVVPDPIAFSAIRGRSVLYLGNHQTGVESLLFSILASGLNGVPTVTLAKAEHRHTWLGKLIAHCFSYPGVRDPKVISFFDREDKESLPQIIGDLAAEMAGPGKSVMVHVEGTRSLDCRTPVSKMSGAFIDMALAVGAPIVPIRFVGGLPVQPLTERLEFPLGMGSQDIWLGTPLLPADLRPMPYGERKKVVMRAINALGPPWELEQPNPGDPEFADRVAAHRAAHPDVDQEHAVLHCVLSETAHCDAVGALLAGDVLPDSAEGAWLAELRRRLFGAKLGG